MRDQYAGDISDVLKFAFLRELVGRDRTLGIAWYYAPGDDMRPDGRHIAGAWIDSFFCVIDMLRNGRSVKLRARVVAVPARHAAAIESLSLPRVRLSEEG